MSTENSTPLALCTQTVQTTELPRSTPRFDGVDVLRGISILAVVMHHCYILFLLQGHNLRSVIPRFALSLLFANGGNGVTVFFAVSGFLITYTSLRRFGGLDRLKASVFYRIRFARIAPLLLAVLLILSVLHLLHVHYFFISEKRGGLLRALFAALTFHLNWYEAKHGYLPGNWDVMWSLSIEEMFYLFFPPVCLLLLRVRRGGMAMLCAVFAVFVVLAPFGRTMWAATELDAEKSYLGGFGSIALGCLSALLLRRWQSRSMPSRKVLLALACAGGVVMLFSEPPFRMTAVRPVLHWLAVRDLDDTLLSLGTCMVMLGVVARGNAGARWLAPVRWYGRLSYEVYLLHEFLVIAVVTLALHLGQTTGRGLGRGMVAWSVLVVLCSGCVGWLAARYFTEPLNRRLRGVRHPAEP